MKVIDVRPATPQDLDGVLAANVALFAEDAAVRDPLRNAAWPVAHGRQWCADRIDDPDALVLVAVSPTGSNPEVVGHLIGTFAEPSDMWRAAQAELVSMYVAPPDRGCGVGGRLVAGLTSWAGARGASRVRVSAYVANEDAVRFYRSQGFAPHAIELVTAVPSPEAG